GRPGFSLPVGVLSGVYRGKFLAGLRTAFAAGKLTGCADAAAFEAWLAGLVRHEWVVYAQPPAAGPLVVLKYLARYVHRVALAESRLGRGDGAGVTFTWEDYAGGGRGKEGALGGGGVLPRRLVDRRAR